MLKPPKNFLKTCLHFLDDRSVLLASGTLEGKQPVDLNIYLNPHDLGEVEFGCESTE
jgi:hypothetical protein